MKSKLLLPAIAASLIGSAGATITLNTQFGTAFDSSGTPVPAGTLYALVIDSDNNNTFAGNFGLNSNLGIVGASLVFTPGQTLTLGGSLGSDTIFYLGAFDGAAEGITAESIQLTLGVNGVASGRSFAFYWFPGATLGSANSATIGSQIGGLHTTGTAESGLEAMMIPADGAILAIGAATSDAGGTIPNEQFTANGWIPEPSTAFLSLLGALGLFRRRR
ncbi:PEP-CTERM sorting domain-containing protein [Luteolibacter arcticus]|uniref:PEP-CTERM sorting domain-containing protein n=1 Tax=Luteolibacter arcticus TaxID=1581411 RepID=A0ABT3GER7_9BACT|nr:PEP-CTERM sorting domain-containing protein [Luteolibacter arcticus]MCW1922095.1 PEP-CTERM sorting domain-containing protein [Luteolibacter arcticus]